jgi:hypothetical protein
MCLQQFRQVQAPGCSREAGIAEDMMGKQTFIENKVREATEERHKTSGTKTAKISETKRTEANGAQKLKQKRR